MIYETLTYAVDHNVAVITLNRPTVMNALNTQMRAEITDAMHQRPEAVGRAQETTGRPGGVSLQVGHLALRPSGHDRATPSLAHAQQGRGVVPGRVDHRPRGVQQVDLKLGHKWGRRTGPAVQQLRAVHREVEVHAGRGHVPMQDDLGMQDGSLAVVGASCARALEVGGRATQAQARPEEDPQEEGWAA